MTNKIKNKKTIKTKNKLKNPHYVCTGGCGMETQERVTCNSRGCVRFRNPLTECNCNNNKHGDLPTKNVPRS